MKFIIGLILSFSLIGNVYAGKISSPPPLSKEYADVSEVLYHYLTEIYNNFSDSCILGFASSGGVSIATDRTTYASFMGGAFGTTNFNSTSGRRQHILPYAGRIKKLYIRTTTAQPSGGSLVFTVRKNGTDTIITLTIAAGGSAGTFTDLINTVSFAAGDLIDLKAVNSDVSSISAKINQWSVEYQRAN